MITIAHDPGLVAPAWAVADGQVFVHASMVRPRKGATPGQVADMTVLDVRRVVHPDRALVEQMVHYPRERSQVKGEAARTKVANHLIAITAAGALAMGALVGTDVHYLPAGTWKGRCTKEATKALVYRTLTAGEIVALSGCLARHATHLHHNIYDAVGLLLVGLGRVGLP